MDFVWDDFEIMLGSFWDHLGSSWNHLGLTVGSYWDRLRIILELLWDLFGVMSGSVWDLVGIIVVILHLLISARALRKQSGNVEAPFPKRAADLNTNLVFNIGNLFWAHLSNESHQAFVGPRWPFLCTA